MASDAIIAPTLTFREAARTLGVDVSAVRAMITEGTLERGAGGWPTARGLAPFLTGYARDGRWIRHDNAGAGRQGD